MNEPTKTYDLYEVVKIPFPFTDVKSTKVRPALILTSAKFNARIGMSIMTMITSLKPGRELCSSDTTIEQLSSTGLPSPSIIRFKLFTLDHRLILGRLGVLSAKDRQEVKSKLKEILHL